MAGTGRVGSRPAGYERGSAFLILKRDVDEAKEERHCCAQSNSKMLNLLRTATAMTSQTMRLSSLQSCWWMPMMRSSCDLWDISSDGRSQNL